MPSLAASQSTSCSHVSCKVLIWNFHRVLLALACSCLISLVNGALEDDFISLPAEFASRVPARLVFGQPELIQCWKDTTATRCVFKASIDVDQGTWQQAFQDTGGAALVPPQQAFTLTSEPCTVGGPCLPGGSNVLWTLNYNKLPYAMYVQSGAVLRFSSVQLFNLAPASAYRYSSSTPWKSTGQGTTSWPSIGLAPNAVLVLVNASILYYNPSDTDDCIAYTQKRIFAFRQVWGENNITVVNSTANLIVGPQVIDVTIRNGSTDAPVGNATVIYRNVTFICMENNTVPIQPGISKDALAAAIAVPVGVVLLAGGLLTMFLLRRRRRRRQQGQQQGLLGRGSKGPGACAGARDLETGAGPPDGAADQEALPGQGRDQVKPNRTQQGDSFSSSKDMAEPASALTPMPSKDLQTAPDHASQSSGGAGPVGTRHNSQALQGSGGALHWLDSSIMQSSGGMHGSGGGMQGSGGTYDASTFSTALGSRFGTDGTQSGRAGMEDRLTGVSALLKARSDVAVLRDLKIGPLLGRGSYGRVYKGRWKATPVAVKIIEHHAAGARSSGGKTTSAGRETLLATSVSHPNVVTTYHISTMSMSERSALASSWLEGGGPSGQQAVQELEDDREEDSGSDSEGSTISSLDESPPDLLETWIIMEWCEKGSLERAVRLGKFKRAEGHAEMVGICKALLDTASGLDYLHSIGVVHGDLKTANVLLKGSTKDARGVTCKITDFGLSRVLDPEATHISTGTYGTIVYMPKELLLSGRMTQATDIYSFGLMMWELFTSQPVMDEGLSIGQMFYMIAYEGWRPHIPAGCPAAFADLMTACWHVDPEQRPTAQQLLRRLQRMYVQAKQQYLAARGSQPPLRSSSRSSRRAAVAAATAAAAAAAPPAAAVSPFHSAASVEGDGTGYQQPAGRSVDESTSSESNVVPSRRADTSQQQQALQRMGSSQRPMVRHTCSVHTSSVEEGSSSVDFSVPQMSGRRSTDSRGEDTGHEYQPYVTAVLQRSASVSSPVLGRPHTPVHAALAAAGGEGSPRYAAAVVQDPQQLEQLQQQLAQLQGPAAQQQLLQSYAVFVPPMLPIDVSGSMISPGHTQEGAGLQQGEADLFDKDGLASESLLRQLTDPAAALGGVEYEDHFSGYLHPPSPAGAGTSQQSAGAQSMQQTVEQYRQQLHVLQQQSQLQSQRLL